MKKMLICRTFFGMFSPKFGFYVVLEWLLFTSYCIAADDQLFDRDRAHGTILNDRKCQDLLIMYVGGSESSWTRLSPSSAA